MLLCVLFYFLVCKDIYLNFQGAGVDASTIVQGMVFKRLVEGDVQKVENAKVVVYTCPFDSTQTETKVNFQTSFFPLHVLLLRIK